MPVVPARPTPENSEIAAAAAAAKAAAEAAAADHANTLAQSRITAAKTRLASFLGTRLDAQTLTYTYVGTVESGSVVADDGLAALAVKPDDTVWSVEQGDDGQWSTTGTQVEDLVELADVLEVG